MLICVAVSISSQQNMNNLKENKTCNKDKGKEKIREDMMNN